MKQFFLITLATIVLFQNTFSQVEKYYKVKVFTTSELEIKKFSSLAISKDGLQVKPNVFVIGEFSESELKLIRNENFRYEILIDDLTKYYTERNKGIDINQLTKSMQKSRRKFGKYETPANFSLGSMGGYHTYQEILDELGMMKSLYPDLISFKNAIGLSTTIEGRPVYWVRISNNPDLDQDKPKVLFTALTHAREPAGMQQMLYQMWFYLENYEKDPEIKYLVDNLEILFIPCVNPDGYVYNETNSPLGGGMWRKNLRNNGDGSTGVDLNRNFGFQWGYDNTGSSPDGSSEVYRGAEPFSEPETQLVKQFCEERDIRLALNNHTYSDLLIYPWGYENLLTPDSLIFTEFAKFLTEDNGYLYGTCYETLSYLTNGDSDDWFYGEQTTKNKIMAFTPEAGNPADGFWPQASKIEEICAGHTIMNLYMCRFALAYAKVTDKTHPYISEKNAQFNFEILCLGIDTPSMFTVSMLPISSNIESVGSAVEFSGMKILQKEAGAIAINLKSEVVPGDEVKFAVQLNNGSFTRTDTITKFYGQVETAVDFLCDDLNGWNTSTWGLTSDNFSSSPASITDSPYGFYTSNSNTNIILDQTIDLRGALMANAEFNSFWSIETDWDYAQLQISENDGLSWTPLSGNYTQLGTENQDYGNPIYHGSQTFWVDEFVSLNEYCGKLIKLRFNLVSDAYVNDDGFYFDDFKVVKILDPNYTVGVESAISSNSVQVVYNKANAEIQVFWSDTKSFNKIEIIDLQGRTLFSGSATNLNSYKLSSQKFRQGLYIIRLSGKNLFTKKIML